MAETWGSLSETLVRESIRRRIPISGAFELTSRCNLQCKMCYICQPAREQNIINKERTAKEWIKLAGEARDAGMLFLLLTGGEVFIRKDFKEIYEELSNMGFNINIYTNATLITPQITKWLGRLQPSKISITLYGASPETYQKVCGFADGYKRAVNGIDMLLAEGIVVGLRTTVVMGNAVEFDDLAELADARGIDLGIVNYIAPRREAGCTDPVGNRLSPGDLVEYEEHVQEYNVRTNKQVITDNSTKPGENRIIEGQADAYRCKAGKCEFWVGWDGGMHPCGTFNEPVARPFETGFLKAWEDLGKLCKLVPICEPCQECSIQNYCIKCPARHMLETGCYDKPAPYLCELAKNRAEKKIII